MRKNHKAPKALNFRSRLFASWGLAIGLLFAQPALAAEPLSNDWKFSGSVYLWMAGIGGETSSGGDIDIDFGDIIENLDFTFMGTIGANKGKWGFLADVIYMDLSTNDDVSLGRILTISDMSLTAWIVTPMVTYRVVQSKQVSLDLLAGARYLHLESELKFNVLPNLSDSIDVWNGIVGVKGKVDLDKNWYVPFHFDVGTGETDLTWQAFAGVGYRFSKFDFVAGYRYLEWDFDDGDEGSAVFNDLNLSGPIIGIKFAF